ncbi:neuronal small secreted protein [Caenorhabditis elegans]
MPIVQRDTKHKGVSETVQEIIRELPNDEQYERIGRMLNNSYDAVNKEVAEGKTAIQQKMVMAERRTGERTNSVVQSAGFFILSVILPIIVLF